MNFKVFLFRHSWAKWHQKCPKAVQCFTTLVVNHRNLSICLHGNINTDNIKQKSQQLPAASYTTRTCNDNIFRLCTNKKIILGKPPCATFILLCDFQSAADFCSRSSIFYTCLVLFRVGRSWCERWVTVSPSQGQHENYYLCRLT